MAFALAIGLPPALARAAERLVAVVLVSGDDDGELAGRVEGQTSDLDLQLVIERRARDASGAPQPAPGDAAAIAGRLGARVVIWFERDASSWRVHIAEPAEDREFVRRVAARGDLASSATAEGVALVVRGALRALAAGGTIGVAEPLPPGPSEQLGFALIGWRGVTGGGPTVHQGALVRAGLRLGRWHGDLAAGYHPSVSLDKSNATIELERWSFSVGFGVELGAAPRPEGASWRGGFALDLGATRFVRVTVSASDPLIGTPPEETWSPTGSARVRLGRRLMGRVWLEMAVGAELLLRPPEFGVASGNEFEIHTRVRPIQPFGTLALMIDLG